MVLVSCFMLSRLELGRLPGVSQFLHSSPLRELPLISANWSSVNLSLWSPVSYQNLKQNMENSSD